MGETGIQTGHPHGPELPDRAQALNCFTLSSNAYATKGVPLMLSPGGLSLLCLAPWVAGAVVLLLVVIRRRTFTVIGTPDARPR